MPPTGRIHRWLLAGGLVIAATLAVAAFVGDHPAGAAPTCTIYWTGAAGDGNWATPSNWSLTNGGGSAGRAPGSSDYVCMSAAPKSATVTSSANVTVKGIGWSPTKSVAPSLTVSGSTFSVSGSSPASSVADLTVEGGGVWSGSVTVGAATFANAYLSGPGELTLPKGGTASVTGDTDLVLKAGYKVLVDGTLDVGSASGGGRVDVDKSSTVENAGSVVLADSSLLTSDSSATNLDVLKNDTSGKITYDASAATAAAVIDVPFTNDGTVSVDTGTLMVEDGGTFASTAVDGAGSGTLELYYGDVSGSNQKFGNFVVDGGTYDATGTTSVADLTVEGGGVWSGSVTVGAATFANAYLSGPGELTLPKGGTASVTGDTDLVLKAGYKVLVDGTLDVGSASGGGRVDVDKSSTVENAGSVVLADSSLLTSDSSATNLDVLKNDTSGKITYDASAATAAAVIDVPFTNDGTVSVDTGTLMVEDGGTFASTAVDGAGSGTLELYYGDVSGSNQKFGNFVVDGGTYDATGTTSVADLTVEGGGVWSGSVTVGAATFANAYLSGPGELTLPKGGTASVTGDTDLVLKAGYKVLVDGTLDVGSASGGGRVDVDKSSTVENAGSVVLADSSLLTSDSSATNLDVLKNDTSGKITYDASAATAAAVIDVPFTNDGTVSVDTGTLMVEDGGTFASTAVDGAGSGTLELYYGDVSGSNQKFGNFVVDGGTYDATGTTSVADLTVEGGGVWSGSVTVGAATFANAYLSGPGELTLPKGGTASVTGDTDLVLKAGYKVLVDGTLDVGSASGGGRVDVDKSSTVENAGSVVLADSSLLTSDSSATNLDVLKNDTSGKITYDASAATAAAVIDVPFTNDGTVSVDTGTLTVEDGLSNLVNGTLTGGTYVADGTLYLGGPVTTNAATVSVGAAGEVTDNAGNALVGLADNTGSLTLASSLALTGPLANSGTVDVAGGTLQTSSYSQSAGTTTVAPGATLESGNGSGPVTLAGGTLTGNGTVSGNVSGAGTVAPGRSAGPLAVSGTYVPAGTGTLAIGVVKAGSSPGADFGQLSVGGDATLAGTIAVTTNPKFHPTVGTAYVVLLAAKVSGTFSSISGQVDQPADIYYTLGYTPTSVVLTVKRLPTFSIAAATAVAPDSGTRTISLAVTQSATVPFATSVHYSTADGTAKAGVDYRSISGILTIKAGSTAGRVNVTVLAQPLYGATKTFTVVLATPLNATIASGKATGTITNANKEPTIAVANANITAPLSGTAELTFNVTMSAAGELASTVHYATSDGTAKAGKDYTAASGPLTIPAGQKTGSIKVVILAANGSAGPRAFTVTLSSPVNVTIATAKATGTIESGPMPTKISPASIAPGKSEAVVVTGTNFVTGTSATLAAPGVTFTSAKVVSATTIDATAAAAAKAAKGATTFTVKQGASTGTCTGCMQVT